MKTKPNNRGGKRPGAGRKPSPAKKVMRSYRMSVDVDGFLSTQPNRTQAIEDLVRHSKSFRYWAKNKLKASQKRR